MQKPEWRQYYEMAWETRARYLRELIRAGETNIPRLLHRLDALQRKYRVEGGSQFRRHPWRDDIEMSPAGVPFLRPTTLRGNKIAVPFHATDGGASFIVDYIDEQGPFAAVIELGCGYGRNLFDIYYAGGPKQARYYGGDLTASGVTLGREIAALDPAIDATFFRFDYLAPSLAALPRVDRALVFTCHSIEQVQRIDPELF